MKNLWVWCFIAACVLAFIGTVLACAGYYEFVLLDIPFILCVLLNGDGPKAKQENAARVSYKQNL